MIDLLQAKLDYSDAVADWLLETGRHHIAHGELEEGLRATGSAAAILSRQNRTLSYEPLELNLQLAAAILPVDANLIPSPRLKPGGKVRCLHVLSEALQAGGLTAMAQRWMARDASKRIQSIALLSQRTVLPALLRDTVLDAGGEIHIANPAGSLTDTAIWLRTLAYRNADFVVLHTGSADVICGAAFGIPGGPPVMLVNHTAHTYWTGASIADLVLNCRGSALEATWTDLYRGISRYATAPIPLLGVGPATHSVGANSDTRRQSRENLGLPASALVMLTVGASFKYFPTERLDFVKILEKILFQVPEGWLLVVGVAADDRWLDASHRVGSRIRMLGTLSPVELSLVRQASDIYIEGFPFGTTTALLEAGLDGIPVVLAPSLCPPPYGSDGVALDNVVERSESIELYEQRLMLLCRRADLRAALGETIRKSIAMHHTSPGWECYIERAFASLGHEHRVYNSIATVRTTPEIHEYWADFVSAWNCPLEETVELAISHALSNGLRPRLSSRVRQACVDAQPFRRGRSVPLPVLVALCNFLLPLLPVSVAHILFKLVSHLCRKGAVSRTLRKAAGSFKGHPDPRVWYGEYR